MPKTIRERKGEGRKKGRRMKEGGGKGIKREGERELKGRECID